MMDIKKTLTEFGLEHFNRYYGTYRGFVGDNDDPDNLGRLRLKVPKVYGDTVYKKWALPKGMFSGKGIGSFWIPNVGDTIWVSFENGDPRFPIWDYGWFREGDVPKGASIQNKVLQTTAGHKIELDDDKELIRITDNHGHIVELNAEGVSIVSDTISLGSLNTSAEPAVLGDTAVALLNEFIADVGDIGTITTSTGVTETISTSPLWAPLVLKWKTKWKEFNSSVTTLD